MSPSPEVLLHVHGAPRSPGEAHSILLDEGQGAIRLSQSRGTILFSVKSPNVQKLLDVYIAIMEQEGPLLVCKYPM